MRVYVPLFRNTQLVRHLADGRISTDSFSDSAAVFALDSEDAGVRAVYEAADSLYCDILGPDRFRGRCKLAADVRRKCATAALFLYTDIEYEWPDDACGAGGGDYLLLILCGSLMLAGATFLAFSPVGLLFLLPGIACSSLAIYVYFYSQKLDECDYDRWVGRQNQIGDYDVWPFVRKSDFQDAKEEPRLLAG